MAQSKVVILSKLSGLTDNACALLLKVCAEGCDRCNVQKGNRQSNEILVFGMRMLHATLGDLILDLSMICKGERKAIRGHEPNEESLTRCSILRLLYDLECICDHLGQASCRTAHHAQV